MSVQKKDKEKVLDDVWTEEHIQSFLNIQPPAGIDQDFHALHTAYKSMRLDDFEIFLGFFTAAGRNTHAKNPYGETALDIIKQHRRGADYAQLLDQVA